MRKFLKDFKDFAMRGNVIDMAVGVVIGASFGKIVTGLVNYIINPILGFIIPSGNLDSVKTVITAADPDAGIEEVAILWGTWLQTIIDFLITALCIFLFLKIIMKAKNTIEAKKIAAEKAAEEEKKAEEERKAAEAEAAVKDKEDRLIAAEESVQRQEALLTEIRAALLKR